MSISIVSADFVAVKGPEAERNAVSTLVVQYTASAFFRYSAIGSPSTSL